MKIFLILTLCFYSIFSYSATFQGSFWEKNTSCPDNPFNCLPNAVEKPSLFEFEYPNVGETTEFEINGKKYIAKILIAHKLSNPDYYVIQTSLMDLSNRILALCSRYEAVRTMESVPVGGCAGTLNDENSTIAGFSIALPN